MPSRNYLPFERAERTTDVLLNCHCEQSEAICQIFADSKKIATAFGLALTSIYFDYLVTMLNYYQIIKS